MELTHTPAQSQITEAQKKGGGTQKNRNNAKKNCAPPICHKTPGKREWLDSPKLTKEARNPAGLGFSATFFEVSPKTPPKILFLNFYYFPKISSVFQKIFRFSPAKKEF